VFAEERLSVPGRSQARTIPASPISRIRPYTVPGSQTYRSYSLIAAANGFTTAVSGLPRT